VVQGLQIGGTSCGRSPQPFHAKTLFPYLNFWRRKPHSVARRALVEWIGNSLPVLTTSSKSERQIQNSTRNLYLLVVL
jgi:hypothetical protein